MFLTLLCQHDQSCIKLAQLALKSLKYMQKIQLQYYGSFTNLQVCHISTMPFQKFPFALPQNSPSLQNQILPGSCFTHKEVAQTLLCHLKPQSLSREDLKDYKVLFSGSLLRTLAAVGDLRAFLCLCFFSDLLHGTVRSGVVRNGVGYKRNFNPETQLKLQTFTPPVPACKQE